MLDAGAQTVTVGGEALIADCSGALYWERERTLLVADLHLEKASAYAEAGTLLPPYDTRETLARLGKAILCHDPRRVVALGDSFHRPGAADRMARDDLAALRALQRGRDWVWIAGNHDPEPGSRAGGEVVGQLALGPLTLRHEPLTASGAHEIAGHLHPAAKLSMYGTTIRRPCFIGNGSRLVMPAFGAFAGGLNVLDAAFRPLFGNGDIAVWMLGRNRLYPIAARALSAD
jgi:DNA ligase-associated metallophosphoesterase